MTPSFERVPRFRDELHSRMRRRWNNDLVSVAHTVGNKDTLDLVLDEILLGCDRFQVEHGMLLIDLTLSLTPVLSSRSMPNGIAATTWSQIASLRHADDELFRGMSHRIASLASRFPSPNVIKSLVDWARLSEGIHRYSFYSWLTECTLPEQLTGWNSISVEDTV